jgi:hypothetical protein
MRSIPSAESRVWLAGINGRSPTERVAVRQVESVPRLVDLERFLRAALREISAKSTLARAIRYALSRWDALTHYTSDGRLEMTNNAAERAIRPASRFSRCSAVRRWRGR